MPRPGDIVDRVVSGTVDTKILTDNLEILVFITIWQNRGTSVILEFDGCNYNVHIPQFPVAL
jgi:hypothetical protein